MDNDNTIKSCIIYIGTIVSSVTASDILTVTTIVYTVMQILRLVQHFRQGKL